MPLARLSDDTLKYLFVSGGRNVTKIENHE